MKKRLLFILCLVLSVVMIFASCDSSADSNGGGAGNENTGNNSTGNNNTGNNNTCDHTFSEGWTMNETHHWHAATCEHGENKGAYAEHADVDEDGICDSCEYEVGHEHTYASEWLSDVNNHWKAATCSHTDRVGDLGLHVDDNSDAKCDSCGAHVHVLTTSGMCRGCGEQVKNIDNSNISSVIQSVIDHYGNVSGGQVTLQYKGTSSGGYYSNSSSIVDYAFGNNCTYIKIANSSDVYSTDKDGNPYYADNVSVIEKWHENRADGSLFGAYRESVDGVVGDLHEDASVSENTLYGYYYSVSTLAQGYGAEGILKALYERSQEDGASKFAYTHEEGTNTYQFSYEYALVNSMSTTVGLVVNVNYFIVSVEFTYDDDYTLTNLKISCDCYTNDAGALPDGSLDTANVDLVYDTATGTITLLNTAKADTYTFNTNQTVGERTFVNEYTKEYFAPKGFLVYSDLECTTACPDTITVSLSGSDKYARFYLQDSEGQKFTSATAEALEWTTSDESGLSANWSIVGNAFSFKDSSVRFLAKKAGTYTVTFTYQDVTKTFTVVVTA